MILETSRLILREFEEEDWQAILSYQSDPEYLRYYPWNSRSEIDVRSHVHMFISWSRERPRKKYQFVIILKDEQRLIGHCGLRKEQPLSSMSDLGYELNRSYWGRGLATEAALALVHFGFEELRLHRIWAHCVEQNTASARVLEKIGMRYEGCLLESEWMKDRWWNVKLYAILAQEWLSLQ